MTATLARADLEVSADLALFIERKALPGTAIAPEQFWAALADIFRRFVPDSRMLLAERDRMQARIDQWWTERRGGRFGPDGYEALLRELGYLLPEPAPFKVTSSNVDAEVASMAGPQLVVPALNERFVLNAANARWGSVYDALYGTDALPESCRRKTTMRNAARRSSSVSKRSSTQLFRSPQASAIAKSRAGASRMARCSPRWLILQPSRAIAVLPNRRRAFCSATTGSASSWSSIVRTRSALPTRPG